MEECRLSPHCKNKLHAFEQLKGYVVGKQQTRRLRGGWRMSQDQIIQSLWAIYRVQFSLESNILKFGSR